MGIRRGTGVKNRILRAIRDQKRILLRGLESKNSILKTIRDQKRIRGN